MGANIADHIIDVEMKILDKGLPYPEYQTAGAAAIDLYSSKEFWLWPGQVMLVGVGIAIHIGTPACAGFILPRSGLGVKHGLVLANGTGLIDSDYQGELGVALWNRQAVQSGDGAHKGNPERVMRGDRIAQLVFMPVLIANLLRVTEFGETTDRGVDGLGSTGRR